MDRSSYEKFYGIVSLSFGVLVEQTYYLLSKKYFISVILDYYRSWDLGCTIFLASNCELEWVLAGRLKDD